MLIGYARVSTHDPPVDLQLDAFTKAGCDRVFTDTFTSAETDRPGYTEALEYMRPDDTLVVWHLSSLGQSLKELIQTINSLHQRGIHFKSLKESIDTTTDDAGQLFHLFSALAEFERHRIHAQTSAGLRGARARGRLGGRPKIEDQDPKKIAWPANFMRVEPCLSKRYATDLVSDG